MSALTNYMHFKYRIHTKRYQKKIQSNDHNWRALRMFQILQSHHLVLHHCIFFQNFGRMPTLIRNIAQMVSHWSYIHLCKEFRGILRRKNEPLMVKATASGLCPKDTEANLVFDWEIDRESERERERERERKRKKEKERERYREGKSSDHR
jgi:hypothetical protein